MPRPAPGEFGQHLAIQLHAITGESLWGLIYRLAAANWVRPSSLVYDVGGKTSFYNLPNDALGQLSTLSGIPVENLRLMRIGRTSGGHIFEGHKVSRHLLMMRKKRLCVDCLAESGFHQNIWNFRPISFCQKHLTPLMSACPVCRADLLWGGQHLHRCDNGHDLLNFTGMNASPPDPGIIAEARYLASLLQDSTDQIEPLHPVFGSRNWNFSSVVKFLSLLENFAYRRQRCVGRTMRSATENGFVNARSMLQDWPDPFRRFTPLGKAARAEITMIEPELHRLLLVEPVLAEQYRKHVCATNMRWPVRFFRHTGTSHVISSQEGSDLLQIPRHEFNERAHQNGWAIWEGRAAAARRYDKNKILEWRNSSVALSRPEAKKRLGVHPLVLERLCERGCVRKIDVHSRKVDARGRARLNDLHREDIAALESLMDAANPLCENNLYFSLSAAIPRLRRYEIAVGDFVEALRGGQIKAYGSKKNRLLDIEISVVEVLEWLAPHTKASRNLPMSVSKKLIAAAKRYSLEKGYLDGHERSLPGGDLRLARAA